MKARVLFAGRIAAALVCGAIVGVREASCPALAAATFFEQRSSGGKFHCRFRVSLELSDSVVVVDIRSSCDCASVAEVSRRRTFRRLTIDGIVTVDLARLPARVTPGIWVDVEGDLRFFPVPVPVA